MTVSNCPRCSEPFRLPVVPDDAGGLPNGAYGQCPWCRETFPMSELLRALPPMLTVMSADGHPIQSTSRAMATASTTAASTAVGAASAESFLDDDLEVVDDPNATIADETIGEETVNDELWGDAGVATEGLPPQDDHDHQLNDDDFDNDEFLVDEDDSTADDSTAHGPMNIELENISDDWGTVTTDADSIAPMRVARDSRSSRGRKKSAPWKTAVGVLIGGAAALPIADGILTVAGRESILKIWPASWSSSSDSGSSGRSASAPMVLADSATERSKSATERSKAAGRTLSMPTVPQDAVSVDESASEVLDQINSTPRNSAANLGDSAMTMPAVADYSAVDEIAEEEPATPPKAEKFEMPAAEPKTDSIELPNVSIVEKEPLEPASVAAETVEKEAAATQATGTSELAATPESAATSEPEMDPANSASGATPLDEAVSDANQMLDTVLSMSDDDPQRRKALAMTYREIAEVASLADTDNTAARNLLVRVKQSPLLKTYENASANWFTHASRQTDGILIIGKAGSSSQGPTITVGSDRTVLVKEGPPLPTSDRVIALGRIVGDGSEAVIDVAVAEPL